jgi:hypothetical protein
VEEVGPHYVLCVFPQHAQTLNHVRQLNIGEQIKLENTQIFSVVRTKCKVSHETTQQQLTNEIKLCENIQQWRGSEHHLQGNKMRPRVHKLFSDGIRCHLQRAKTAKRVRDFSSIAHARNKHTNCQNKTLIDTPVDYGDQLMRPELGEHRNGVPV